jgi:MFS family permease
MAIGSLAVAVAVCAVPYLPTNDGPQHILSGFLQKAFSEPGSPYSAVLEPLPEFAERGFSLVFVPMLELLSWRGALSATLVLVALSGAWAFAGLACALARQRTPWALLGFALAFPWTFYMGFLPFVLAANIGMAIVAFAIHREEPRRMHLFLLAVMLLVDAVMHVGAAATTGLMVFLVFLLRAQRGQRLRAVGIVALVGAPAAAVLAGVLLSSSPLSGAKDPWMWTPRLQLLAELPRFVVPGPLPRAMAGCLLVVLGLFVGLRRARRREASRAELAVLAAALLFLTCAVIGPLDLPGWQLVAPRFASLGVPLAVVLLAPLWPTRSPRLALVVIFVLTGTSLALTYEFHQRLSRGCEPALAGLVAPVNLAGFTLPMPLESYCGVVPDPKVSEVPHLAPLFHIGALYAVARGGLTPYMFGGSTAVHAFRYRADASSRGIPPRPPPQLYLALVGNDGRTDRDKRDYLIARFAEYGRAHQHLLVVGAREGELASILARGYVADWQTESAMIAHPRACTLDVLVDTDDARGVIVEIGQRPIGDAVYAMRAEGVVAQEDGTRRLTLSEGGCGPLWVRGFLDVDASGGASKGDVFCAGAGRDGSLNVDVIDRASVRCRIERPARPAAP